MNGVKRVAVLGGSGFVGSSVVAALQARNHDVVSMRAPRLPAMLPQDAETYIASTPELLIDLVNRLADIDVVINAAGDPDASSQDKTVLYSANGVLPGLVAAACIAAHVPRLVHVSSTVVQGRLPILDDSTTLDAFSTYSRSKALGEMLVSKLAPDVAVIYRPPGVHSVDRRISKLIARIGTSPLSSVARPMSSPSPQALIQNVGDALAFLAVTALNPPNIVLHPWENLTTGDVMQILGGRPPLVIPRTIAKMLVTTFAAFGTLVKPLAVNARRVEMMWFGQAQATSWLTTTGWIPPAGREAWVELGESLKVNRTRDPK